MKQSEILDTMYRTLDWKEIYMEVWGKKLLEQVSPKRGD